MEWKCQAMENRVGGSSSLADNLPTSYKLMSQDSVVIYIYLLAHGN